MYLLRNKQMHFLRLEYGPLEPVLHPSFISAGLKSLMKEISIYKKMQSLSRFIEVECGERRWNLY